MVEETSYIRVEQNPLTGDTPVLAYYSPFSEETEIPEMFADLGIVFTHLYIDTMTRRIIYFTIEQPCSISEQTL